MKAEELKSFLSDDYDKIEKLLDSLGCHKIWQSSSDEIRCASPTGDNKTSISVKMNSLGVSYFSDGVKVGDIIGLVEHLKDYDFSSAMRYIKSLFGIGNGNYKVHVENPLAILRQHKSKAHFTSLNDIEVEKFPMTMLNRYVRMPHFELVKEGIIPSTQELFDICYDDRLNRVLFPHFAYDDKEKIVGIAGRTLESKEVMEEFDIPKYWNYIKGYKKRYNLYGFSHSLENIKKYKKIIIFEAEKSVLKQNVFTKGEGISVALGSHELSDTQVRIILKYTPPETEIIIALDKDVMVNEVKDSEGNTITGEQFIINMCKKLSNHRKVTYIFDTHNILGDKNSPVDKGFKIWNYLLKYRKEVL